MRSTIVRELVSFPSCLVSELQQLPSLGLEPRIIFSDLLNKSLAGLKE